ncbi:Dynein light chain Tctex-type, partial [Haplosporangium sp. Z 27]
KQQFDTTAATKVLENVVKKTLKDVTYRADLVPEWQSAISQETITRLTQSKSPFKYIVITTILENVGSGVHITSTSLWDAESDGSAVYRFENKSLIAVVYAFGLSV